MFLASMLSLDIACFRKPRGPRAHYPVYSGFPILTGWGMNWWLGGVAAVQDGANSLDWDILVD